MALKEVRTDLLIEWVRKMVYGDDFSCYWCPISNKCNGSLLCDEKNKNTFESLVIDKFSCEIEVVDDKTD